MTIAFWIAVGFCVRHFAPILWQKMKREPTLAEKRRNPNRTMGRGGQ